MGFEPLNNSAAWGHLDGVLVYPLFVDENHVLITEDGHCLLVPRGMRVPFAGRVGIGTDGVPFVDALGVTGDDIAKIAKWGAGLQSDSVMEAVRNAVALTLAQVDDPAVYVHEPERTADV